MPNSKHGWSEREENRTQLQRYLVVGLLSVLTDYAVYQLLTGRGLSSAAAKGLSYVAGMILGFVGNKSWTFRSARRSPGEVLSYLGLYSATLGLNVGVNEAAQSILATVISSTWSATFAFLVATGVTTVVNFLGLKFITFRLGIDQRRKALQRSDPRSEMTETSQEPI